MGGFLNNLLNAGKYALSTAGYVAHLPGLGISEPVGQAYAAGTTPDKTYSGSGQSVLGASTPNYSPVTTSINPNAGASPAPQGGALPSGGGQAAAPSGGNNGGNSGPSTDDQYISSLRNAYGENAQALQAQGPLLDQAYNQGTTDINNQIDQQQKAADLQKTQNAQNFGDILRQNAQTHNEIGQQQRGTFSGLGTLDSSAFQDATLKNDQDLSDNQSKTQNQQAIQSNTIDNALTSFRQNALSKLADLGNQYQQGKLGISQALANNDLASANAIQQGLSSIRAQAQNVQNSIMNFGLQAGLLSGYGKDVLGTIQGATGADSIGKILQSITNAQQAANQTYQIPNGGFQSNLLGQGYIGSTKKDANGNPIQ